MVPLQKCKCLHGLIGYGCIHKDVGSDRSDKSLNVEIHHPMAILLLSMAARCVITLAAGSVQMIYKCDERVCDAFSSSVVDIRKDFGGLTRSPASRV